MNASESKQRNLSPLWRFSPLAVALAAAAFQLPFFDRTMSVLDEGHILMFADLVANGGELYRDATLLPLPGAFYLLALAFDLFCSSILVARWILLIEFALLCAFGFVILRRIASTRAAWVGVGLLFVYRVWAFPHWHMYSYSTTSLCLLAGALVCVMRYFEKDDVRWLGATGLAAGLAVFCKQDYGVGGLVALNFAVLLECTSPRAGSRKPLLRHLAWLNGPAAAVGVATALHFARQGLFREMLQQTLLNHLIGITTFEYSSLPPLMPLFEQSELIRSPYGRGSYTPSILFTFDWARITSSGLYNGTILWELAVKLFFYGPYLFLTFGGIRLWRRREALRDGSRRLLYLQEFALFAVAALLMLILNKPVDYVHVIVLYWPMILLGVVYAHSFIREREIPALWVGAAALPPALALISYSAFLLMALMEANDTPLRGDRAGIRVLETEARIIGEATDYVITRTTPDQPVAVLPYYPLISFLADRRAPHRTTYTFWPIRYIPDRERQIIDAMEAADTEHLIYHFTQFVQFPRMEEYAPELFAYLVETYDIDEVISDPHWGMMLAGLKRGDASAEGEPLFTSDAANAVVSVELANGSRRMLLPDERGELLTTAIWPFRPVLALRPLTGARRSAMSVTIDVPPNARLRTEVGVHPKHWFRVPPAIVTFTTSASIEGEKVLLAKRTLNPHSNYRDRHWFEIDVDLGEYAGRRVEIEFTAHTNRVEGEVFEMGGWATPRIVTK